jgi:hypothetical protein
MWKVVERDIRTGRGDNSGWGRCIAVVGYYGEGGIRVIKQISKLMKRERERRERLRGKIKYIATSKETTRCLHELRHRLQEEGVVQYGGKVQ